MIHKLKLHEHPNAIGAGIALFVWVIYLTTMNPTVSFIDCGELAAVCSMLGVAHPTGYPLFTLLGRLFVMLPFGQEEIFQLNLMSAFFVASSIGIFFRLLIEFRASSLLFRAKKQNRDAQAATAYALSAISIALSFAFVSTVWAQSVALEVYSLHLFLIGLILLTFVRGMAELNEDTKLIPRSLILCAFISGLSFANHMTTILLVPGLSILFFRVFGWGKDSLFRALKMIPFFFVGLSVYIYLPIRSSSGVPLNWGFTGEFERFLWHITGKQYRSWIFSGFESASKQFKYFLENFENEYHLFFLVFVVLGIWYLWNQARRLLMFVIVLFLSCVLYAINYDIHDIDSYFLLAFLSVGVVITFGLSFVIEWILKNRSKLSYPLAMLVLVVLPLIQLNYHRSLVDESDNQLTKDYVSNVFTSLEQNALVLTYQWDYFVSPALYYQHIGRIRKDVTILDKELFRRSWYFKQLQRTNPKIIEKSKEKIDLFLRELHKFEHKETYIPSVIELRFNEMINDIISKALEERPVYLGNEIEPHFAGDYVRHPEGIMQRIGAILREQNVIKGELRVRIPKISNRLTRGLLRQYSVYYTLRATEEFRKGDVEQSKKHVQRALSIDPAFQPAIALSRNLPK